MTQLDIYSAIDRETAGDLLKRLGQHQAASKPGRSVFLDLARLLAARAALRRMDRTATADDARDGFERAELPWELLGNAAGVIFRGQEWEPTDRFSPSRWPARRGGMLRVWRFVGGG